MEFPQFPGTQGEILRGLRRGEKPDDIAVRLNTTVQYVYTTRSRAKKMGITITSNSIQLHQQQQIPQIVDPSLNAGSSNSDEDLPFAVEFIQWMKAFSRPSVTQSPLTPPPKEQTWPEFLDELNVNMMKLLMMMPYCAAYGAMLRYMSRMI